MKFLTKTRVLKLTFIASTFFILGCNKTTITKKYITPSSKSLDFSNTYVYDSSSKYKDLLKKCVVSNDLIKSCTLNELPLIRKDGKITKEKIKERLVVSNKWMGDRFLQLLDKLEPDVLTMLGSVTAIVIDDDVHPAFYTTQTGAIYLDPRYLWVTPDEAKDITIKDDFRKSYGNSLKFIPAWRYVKNSQVAIKKWDIKNPIKRDIDSVKLNLARLLYHELSHANDFANKDVVDGANRDIPIVKALEERKEYRVSTQLYESMPLTELTLSHLGKVLYAGKKANSEDKILMPEDVGSIFATDNATNMYNYTNQYEDLAMMFESALMKYHYNIDMDIAFVSRPKKANSCNDYVVGWGVRNRIAKDSIKPRVKFILNKILPNSANWDDFLDNGVGKKSSLSTNIGWCSSININSSKKLRLINEQSSKPIPYQDFMKPEI